MDLQYTARFWKVKLEAAKPSLPRAEPGSCDGDGSTLMNPLACSSPRTRRLRSSSMSFGTMRHPPSTRGGSWRTDEPWRTLSRVRLDLDAHSPAKMSNKGRIPRGKSFLFASAFRKISASWNVGTKTMHWLMSN